MRYFTKAPSSEAAKAAAVVRRETGKEPATIIAHYDIGEIALPSGRAERAGNGNEGGIVVFQQNPGTVRLQGDPSGVVIQTGPWTAESLFKHFHPGGLVEIDPTRVVSSRPAERYVVLPQEAGLLQLVRSGALAENRDREFLIKQKIRFPAELRAAPAMKFLLLRGGPEPEGDPGRACVIVEATGEPWRKESLCR
jgi:hypothetical protein